MDIAPVLLNFLLDVDFLHVEIVGDRQGPAVVLVEQNARLALSLADRGYVLETGNVALHGPASELRGNDLVKKTYLGISDD